MACCWRVWPIVASISLGTATSKADSHVDIPVDKRSLKAILQDDAKPYEWMSTSLTA